MTLAISKELQFLAGHDFYVKLTPMGKALPNKPRKMLGFVPQPNLHITTDNLGIDYD